MKWGLEKIILKIGLTVILSLIIAVASLSLPLTFAEYNWSWNSVKVSAYGTDLVENDPNPEMFSFIVATPPQGSEISNLISAILSSDGWETNRTLLPGDFVSIDYLNKSIVDLNLTASSEPGYFFIIFEGDANSVIINTHQIPEFPSWTILPIFLVATLSVLIIKKRLFHNY